MGKIAFVFPGQGSQVPGMGKDIFEKRPEARQVFETADSALGFDLSRLCFEGPEDQLQLTANTQPSILTTSVALLRAAEKSGLRADLLAGHSLGEYTALVASGAISFEEAVTTVRRRGEFMQQAVPVGTGAMAAILGLDAQAVEGACKEAAHGEVVAPANLNSPEQTVIAGHKAAVERAVEIAKEKGARRAMLLSVSAPFHCELMLPAQKQLEKVLRGLKWGKLNIPIVTNADAQLVVEAADAQNALIRQVSSPVRWSESVLALNQAGADVFVEIGPGKVLAGLIKRVVREVRVFNISDEASLDATVSELRAG
ncbi:MAG: ACP S-malonyltransferase [Acidobacteriota bacterium]